MFSQNPSLIKVFKNSCFCGSIGFSLSKGRNVGRGKAAYIWISPDPAQAGPTLGGGVDVVKYFYYSLNYFILVYFALICFTSN